MVLLTLLGGWIQTSWDISYAMATGLLIGMVAAAWIPSRGDIHGPNS